LNQKEDQESGQTQTDRMAAVIHSCFILHNILIELNDDMNCGLELSEEAEDEEDLEQNVSKTTQAGAVVREQVKHYLFINRDFLQQ
jgi:hypothetical protein